MGVLDDAARGRNFADRFADHLDRVLLALLAEPPRLLEVDGELVLVGVVRLVVSVRRPLHVEPHREEVVNPTAASVNQRVLNH